MRTISSAAFALSALAWCGPATAQSPEAFYAGNSIELRIGYTAGGGYDVYARLLAQHLGKHIPGRPNVVPVNAPGAGSLVATNWLYSVAPKDGSVIAAIGRGAAFEPLIGNTKAQFDALKFNWIGSLNNEVSVCVAWHTTGITRFDQLQKQKLVVGGTGPSADTDVFPQVIAAVFGAKLELITGYPGGNEINLAMERGEVQGRCGWSWSSVKSTRANWLQDKKINVLAQLALKKHEDLPKVPLILDLAKNDDQRRSLRLVFARQSMGRPIVAPPGLPADRIATLRQAFDATVNDPAYVADAARQKLEVDPVSGKEIEGLLAEVYETPKPIVERVAKILAPPKPTARAK